MSEDIRQRVDRLEARLSAIEWRLWVLTLLGSAAGSILGTGASAVASTLLGGP